MQSYAELNPNIICCHCCRTAVETYYIIRGGEVLALHLCSAHRYMRCIFGTFDTESEALINLVTRNLS